MYSAERKLQMLHNLAGGPEGDVVKIFEDDATHHWFLKVGEKTYADGNSFYEMLDNAVDTERSL